MKKPAEIGRRRCGKWATIVSFQQYFAARVRNPFRTAEKAPYKKGFCAGVLHSLRPRLLDINQVLGSSIFLFCAHSYWKVFSGIMIIRELYLDLFL